MHIIALKGTHDSGKTTTLDALYQMMNTNTIRFTSVIPRKTVRARDFYASFQDTQTKKEIGIYSEGDGEKSILDAHALFKNNVDILVCACRSSGSTIHAVNKISTSFPDYIGKSISSDSSRHNILNNADAKLIFELF